MPRSGNSQLPTSDSILFSEIDRIVRAKRAPSPCLDAFLKALLDCQTYTLGQSKFFG